jgi:hypothetical protein
MHAIRKFPSDAIRIKDKRRGEMFILARLEITASAI